MPLTLTITDVGRAALANAQNNGLLPIVVSEVAIGTGLWQPSTSATVLQNELKRIDTIGGHAASGDTIHITVTDQSADTYALAEIGLYLNTGELLAIIADDTAPITIKSVDALTLISGNLQFVGVPAGAITVDSTGFTNPLATTSMAGVAELATDVEAITKTAPDKVITAKNLLALVSSTSYAGFIRTATDLEALAKSLTGVAITPQNLAVVIATTTLRGLIEIATNSEGTAGIDTQRAITAAVLNFVLNNRNATTTKTGLAEIATFLETQTGNDNLRFVTPAALASLTSTTSRRGLIETSTIAETQSLTDNSVAVTPAGLQQVLSDKGLDTSTVIHGNGIDANTLTEFGFYSINQSTNTPNNSPYWFYIDVIKHSATYILQRAHQLSSGSDSMFIRRMTAGNWSAWKEVVLDINTASESEVGVVELATSVEVHDGADAFRVVTPATLSALNAESYRAGLIALSTIAEANEGIEIFKAITPSTLRQTLENTGLKSFVKATSINHDLNTLIVQGVYSVNGPVNGPAIPVWYYVEVFRYTDSYILQRATTLNNNHNHTSFRTLENGIWTPWKETITSARTASQTQSGIAELATPAETIAGTDPLRTVTPAGTQAALELWAPAGAITMSGGDTPPTGFLECNGAIISRVTYPRLFANIGTDWGAGDGSSTFAIPDLRSEFIRGWDNGRGIDVGRQQRSSQNDDIKSHNHYISNSSANGSNQNTGFYADKGGADNQSGIYTNSTGGSETRPRNIALMFIIKY